MGISVTRDPLGDIQGYYLLYSGIKCICINSEIDDMNEIRIIAGHELGHSVLHETERCMFYPIIDAEMTADNGNDLYILVDG